MNKEKGRRSRRPDANGCRRQTLSYRLLALFYFVLAFLQMCTSHRNKYLFFPFILHFYQLFTPDHKYILFNIFLKCDTVCYLNILVKGTSQISLSLRKRERWGYLIQHYKKKYTIDRIAEYGIAHGIPSGCLTIFFSSVQCKTFSAEPNPFSLSE